MKHKKIKLNVIIYGLLSIFFIAILYLSSQTTDDIKEINEYNNIEILPVSLIERGMKAYGYSVFSGLDLEKFDADILGIVDIGYDKKLIMTKLYNNKWVEIGGISQGMSGSPVFIDGKLIGAVSSTFTWLKEPIAFLRPIEEMIDLLNKENREEDDNFPIDFIPLEKSMAEEFWKNENNQIYHSKYKKVLDNKPDNDSYTPTKIITPLIFTGFDNSVLNLIKDELTEYGFNAISGGTLSTQNLPENYDPELRPGDAVGLQLLRGDYNAYSIGTVTYRKDNKILIFGHQAFSMGNFDIPLFKGYIYTTVPIQAISFKYGSPLVEVGKATYDFYSGVVGEMGSYAKMIPINIKISNNDNICESNVEIVSDYLFFPNFLSATILQSILKVLPHNQEYSIEFDFNIKVKNLSNNKIDTVNLTNFISSTNSVPIIFTVAYNFIRPSCLLMRNYFAETEILSIEFEANIINNKHIGFIENILMYDNDVYPGKEIEVYVKISSEHKGDIIKSVKLEIPKHFKEDDKITINVSNRQTQYNYMLKKNPSIAKYKSYEELLKVLQAKKDNNELVVWVEKYENSLIIKGEELPGLPDSLYKILNSNNDKNMNYGNYIEPILEKAFKTNYLLSGLKQLTIKLNKGK